MVKIILATHAAFTDPHTDVHGPPHSVSRYLNKKHISHIFLRFPIYGGFPSVREQDGMTCSLKGERIPNFLRPIWELWMILRVGFEQRNAHVIFIGVDPLNAFAGILLRMVGWVEYVIFYTPDFTQHRFGNTYINSVYHAIDSWTARMSDQVWCVSRSIVARRRKLGVSRKKLYYLPNTPSVSMIKGVRHKKRDIYRLVMVGNIIPTLDYSFMIDAVQNLHVFFPDITLSIVGGGEYMNRLKVMVVTRGLQKTIQFTGQLSHEHVIALLKSCGIGVALYTGKNSTNLSGDSMKIREYFACGLPVITTGVIETAKVVKKYKAGEIIQIRQEEFTRAITKIYDKYRYDEYKQNAMRAARDYDFDKMIEKPLRQFNL